MDGQTDARMGGRTDRPTDRHTGRMDHMDHTPGPLNGLRGTIGQIHGRTDGADTTDRRMGEQTNGPD